MRKLARFTRSGAGKVAEARDYVKHNKGSLLKSHFNPAGVLEVPVVAPFADRRENCASGTSCATLSRVLGNDAPRSPQGLS
jgi:hypothetical protein